MKPETALPEINILFLGGSNTVFRNGYYSQTVEELSRHFRLCKVDNHAIGDTTIGMGLSLVLQNKDLASYDMIFIEYCVNDHMANPGAARLAYWQWLFDALLFRIRSANPKTRIYPLLFGRRGKLSCPLQLSLFEGVRTISRKYRAQPIAVDDYLRSGLTESAADESLYSDTTHYVLPDVTLRIAQYIAAFVGEGGALLVREKYERLPESRLTGLQYGDHKLFSSLGESRRFRNSLFDIIAIELKADGPWQEIQIPGEVVQVNFVSTRNSARFIIAEQGKKTVAFDTRAKDSEDFPFLIRNITFNWRAIPKLRGRRKKVAMRVVSSAAGAEDEFKLIRQGRMRPPEDAAEHNVVYLSGAIYG